MNRLFVASFIVLACTPLCPAEEPVREIDWAGLAEAKELPAGNVQPDGWLEVKNDTDQPKVVTILELENPAITKLRYAVTGDVRYADVAEGSYLEMWNFFGDGRRYFTRTLAGAGLLKNLDGSSDARAFSLPFFSSEKAGQPTRLQVNVVFAGPGTVWIGPPTLEQYDQNEDPLKAAGAWWGERTAASVGAVGGCVVGGIGALIGALGGMGRARRLVMTLVYASACFGVVCLVAGITAVGLRQPYAVYYPLLLGGAILTVVMLGCAGGLKRRYQQAELRRMAALDVGGAAV